jgi:GH43 family beta-xylosidase
MKTHDSHHLQGMPRRGDTLLTARFNVRIVTRTLWFLLFFFAASALHAQQKLPLADPFILYHDQLYYAYGTSDANGIVVYTSPDLRYWTKAPALALHKNDSYADRWFWAPEVYHLNGQFYMYYSADEHICVATANSPLGPFKQDVKQPMWEDKAIDHSLFIDDDGKAYLFFVRFTDGNAIWMAELENDYMTIRTNTVRLCFAVSQSWENDMGRVTEGPFCVKHKGYYYLTYSANDYRSQNYGVGYAYTVNLASEWNKYRGNPVLQKPNGLVGTGHHCLFRDKDDQWRMAFHAHKSETGVNPRETYITSVGFAAPPRGADTLTVSPDYQPAYLYDPNTAITPPTNAARTRLALAGQGLSVEGDEIKEIALHAVDGRLVARRAVEPFSFAVRHPGCYLLVIKYEDNASETRKVIL